MALTVKHLSAVQETQVPSLGLEDPCSRGMAATPVFLAGEFHGQRSLVGYSPWGRKESDTTDQLTHIHTDINEKIKHQFIQGPTPVILNLLF